MSVLPISQPRSIYIGKRKYDEGFGGLVWFDDNLSFKQHMHEKISTAFMMLGIIHRNFKHLG